MKLVDANVLLYAVDEDAEHHESARTGLDAALNGTETVIFPWVSVLAFVRLSTNPRVYEHALDPDAALDIVDRWLSNPAVITDVPDRSHSTRLREMLRATGRGGNLVTDGHLAALSLQYGAVILSFDNDFSRFPGVRWERPTSAG